MISRKNRNPYVHRIGRTARAGAEGLAIAFCDRSERGLLRTIERLIRQTIPVMKDHPFVSTGGESREESFAPRRDFRPRSNDRRPSTAAGRNRFQDRRPARAQLPVRQKCVN